MRKFKVTPEPRGPSIGLTIANENEEQTTKWYFSNTSRELLARVRAYAKDQHCSRNTIVKMALEEFLHRHGG